MIKKIEKNCVYWLNIAILGIVLGLAASSVKAWTEPSQSPPNGNVGAPLNTSGIGQIKDAGLVLNAGINSPALLNGLLVPNGRIGLGINTPVAKFDIHSNYQIHPGHQWGSFQIFPENSNNYGNDIMYDGGTDSIFGFTNQGSMGGKTYFNYWPNVGGGSYSNLLTIQNNGNVGVGKESPLARLDVNGEIKLKKYTSQPYACDASHDGAIALTSRYTLCVCRSSDSPRWVQASNGTTLCAW